MGNLAMVRCDHRLIHGQVCGLWVKRLNIKKIVVISDDEANDEFLRMMLEVAAPPGITVACYALEEGIEEWKKNKFGPENLLVIFKYTIDAVNAYKMGMKFGRLNIGQSASGKDKHGNQRKIILKAIYLSEEEAEGLRELNEMGVDVYSQEIPDTTAYKMILELNKAGL